MRAAITAPTGEMGLMKINIKIGDCEFTATVERGVPHIFEVGEPILADKLFYALIGLNKDFEGGVEAGDVNFSRTPANTVLALGDKSMFLKGIVKRNLHKALKLRHRDYKEKAQEVSGKFELDPSTKIKNLSPKELLNLALARAHFRKVDLVVINRCETYLSDLEIPEFESTYTLVIT